MARPKKDTVDYFPHFATHGKTMFILESKWGNDGFAVWFKLLEKLAQCNGHYLDLREETAVLFQAALSHVTEEILLSILDQCAYLKAIDRDLWRYRIVYCQHFVDGVADAYRRRKADVPTIEGAYVYLNTLGVVVSGVSADINPVESGSNPQMKVDETKPDDKKTTAAQPGKTELAFMAVFDEKEGRLRELFPKHNFDIVKECCLAYWRSKAPPADPYEHIVKWFTREHVDRPTGHKQRYQGVSDDFKKAFLGADGKADGAL